MESHYWRFLLQKVITTAHSKSSNSSGFNPILRKFYEMIYKIIVSKTLCGIFFIFFRSSFINNFMVKNNFLEPKNHQNLNISRPIYFKKNFRTPFCRSYLYKYAGSSFFFRKRGAFFATAKPLICASFFFAKNNFIQCFISRVII